MKLRLPKDWSWSYALGGFLVAISLAFAAIMVYASSRRELSSLEWALFQAVILGGGLSGSFLFGRMSALQAARDVVRPHARSAFRRVFSLYKSLYNLSDRIEEMRRDDPDPRLDVIQTTVDEQITTGQDALEDWRDIIQDDIDEILERDGSIDWGSYRRNNAGESTGNTERRSENQDSDQTDSRQGRARSER